MRRFWPIFISALCAGGAAWAEPQAQTLVLELRLGAQSLDAMAWREQDGAFSVEPETLAALGLSAPSNAGPHVRLSAVRGLTYRYNEAESALEITCTSACYAAQTLAEGADAQPGLGPRANGGYFNADLAATKTRRDADAAGLFELGLFNTHGAGGATWSVAQGKTVRLETQWTLDRPQNRTMLRIGDSFTRGGATGVPFRFGGVQFASDFSLDPGFTPYPTPTLHGEAATPSTVDLYVDGALRLRDSVNPGPFSIPDAPVLAGAGVAHIVVTDALGRQREFAQSFYASPSMLRQGLGDYSVAFGAERENFTQVSDDYGRSFASGVYRYGLTNWFTGEVRAETSAKLSGAGVAGSVAATWIGQIDLAYAESYGAHDGDFMRVSWLRQGEHLSLSLETETASKDFRRLGESATEALPKLQTTATIGLNIDRLGSASFAYTERATRDDENVRTMALTVTPRSHARGQLTFNALYVDEAKPYLVVGLGLSLSLHHDVNAGAGVETRDGKLGESVEAQRMPDTSGGYGWRAGASAGQVEHAEVAVLHLGERDESTLELSHVANDDGIRLQTATGVAWIDGAIIAARPIRDAFALVDVGAPGVTVLRDRRPAGVSDARGLVLLTGLRPYQANRIGVTLSDLPMDAQPSTDEIEVVPAAHSGVVARFQMARGAFGEARVVDAQGAPLPPGQILTRRDTGARIPVGYGGRIYVAGLSRAVTFTAGDTCAVQIAPNDLGHNKTLRCGAA